MKNSPQYFKKEMCEWIKKMWHVYTMEYHSAIIRNKTELFVVRWMDLEIAIQSEVSQKEKNKYRTLIHIHGHQKKKKILGNLGTGQEKRRSPREWT